MVEMAQNLQKCILSARALTLSLQLCSEAGLQICQASWCHIAIYNQLQVYSCHLYRVAQHCASELATTSKTCSHQTSPAVEPEAQALTPSAAWQQGTEVAGQWPALRQLAAGLGQGLPGLTAAIHHCIDAKSTALLDKASPELGQARVQRRENKKRLQVEMDTWAQRLHQQGACESRQVSPSSTFTRLQTVLYCHSTVTWTNAYGLWLALMQIIWHSLPGS